MIIAVTEVSPTLAVIGVVLLAVFVAAYLVHRNVTFAVCKTCGVIVPDVIRTQRTAVCPYCNRIRELAWRKP